MQGPKNPSSFFRPEAFGNTCFLVLRVDGKILDMTEGTISSQLHSCRELTIMCAKQMWASGGTCQMATTQHRCMTSAMQDKPNSASTMATTIRWCLVPTLFSKECRQNILYLKGTPGKNKLLAAQATRSPWPNGRGAT